MIRISSDHSVTALGPGLPPAATARSGDIVVFETLDCFANQIVCESQRMGDIDETNANPAAGPLFIQGAEPGDTLKVEILSIKLDDHAVICELPGEGITGKGVEAESIKIIPITEDGAVFSDRLALPLRPMVGVIGTCPADESISTETPDHHGGNLDCIHITEGAAIYLPVLVKGAMLAIGDLHAVMGDGEVCVCGAEIAGEVAVRVSVEKNNRLPTPFVVTAENCMTIFSAETLDEAGEQAVLRMRAFLMDCVGLSAADAGMLLSLTGDLRINQVVNPKKTCRMELPLSVLDKLGYHFSTP